MRKGLGFLLALGLGGAATYGVVSYSASTPAVAAVAYQQQQTGSKGSTASTGSTITKPPQSSTLSNNNYYTNSSGNRVHSPAASSNGVPAGATAKCGDGTYSFSQHHQGTCSHHGGVRAWL
jgi:hypothetical protein